MDHESRFLRQKRLLQFIFLKIISQQNYYRFLRQYFSVFDAKN